MRVARLLALPAVLAALFLTLFAAQSPGAADGAAPAPLARDARPLSQVAQVEMPTVDNDAEIAREILRQGPGVAPRYAVPLATQISPVTHGTSETVNDNLRLWRLRVSAPKAVSINLGFTTYHMPEGGRLFIYTPDYSEIRGPFTAADNEIHGELWTPLLFGDEQVIEVQVPAERWDELRLELSAVLHGFIELGQTPRSGACNVDVVCPEGDGWRDEIRSVAVIGTGSGTFCTGFLVNNTAEDLTPYFMTADHCTVGPGNAASLVAYWNYENSTCRPPGSAASGGPGDGTLDQYNTGAIFRADYGPSDFTLVELDDPIPSEYEVHWAGWDATTADATSAVAIHHPSTDEKRISFEFDPTTTTSYGESASPGDGTHVRVEDWDVGTTEPGSSGSPLFNQDQRVIGQLHGGGAACGNDLPDWYGRMDVSWTGGGTADSSLQPWLDPLSTGQLTLDGRDESSAPDFGLVADPLEQAVCAPGSVDYSVQVTSINNFSDTVTLAFEPSTVPLGLSSINPSSASVPYTSTVTLEPSAANPPGRYDVVLVGTAPTATHTTTLALDLFTAVPGAPVLQAPADGAGDVSLTPTFSWTATTQAGAYRLEVATDAAFTDIVYTAGESSTTHVAQTSLNAETTYYWRATAENACGEMTSGPFSFTTQSASLVCNGATVTFEGGLPSDWSVVDNTSGSGIVWSTTADTSCGISNLTNGGGEAACADSDAAGQGAPPFDTELVTPPMDLSGTIWAYLDVSAYYRDLNAGSNDRFEVDMWDGTTWHSMLSWDESHEPEDFTVDLSPYIEESPVQVRFRYLGDGWDWYAQIDDVTLSCLSVEDAHFLHLPVIRR